MSRQAKARAGNAGKGTAGVVPDSSHRTTRSITPIIPRDPGVLSLEYHITRRSTAALRRDLAAMDTAPAALASALRSRRALTVQALRDRGGYE